MASKTTNHQPELVNEVDANEQLESRVLESEVRKFADLSPLDSDTEFTKTPILAWILVALLLFIGLALTFSALTSFGGNLSFLSKPITESSTPTPTPETVLTPTPIPAKTKKDLRVMVLNGSGTPGLAGVAKSYLESLGYQNIDTGNADSFEYDKTSISIRPNLGLNDQILADLKTKYSISPTIGDLPLTGTYDLEVVVGKE